MSNTQYLGTNAGFYYTPLGDSTWLTFSLAVPLREGRPSYRVNQYVSDSLDLSQRQVLTVMPSFNSSAGVYEYLGTIRYNDDHAGLLQFLKHAALQSGSTTYPVRYTTGLTTGTTSGGMGSGADVWLIEPMGPTWDAVLDRQRASFGDLELSVRFRLYTTELSVAAVYSTASGARWF